MANILSLQSHVAYGYVGNRASVFPLQRLGHEVNFINTVQFSNHTGYGQFSGDIMTLEHIDKLLHGMSALGALSDLDAIITGYIGSQELGAVILQWLKLLRQDNPHLIYCCDPVIGDVGRGVFVQAGVPEFFQTSALNQATILTPNQFELSYLSQQEINSLADAKAACAKLHQHGIKYILVTSLRRTDAAPNQIEMLLSGPDQSLIVATPYLDMPIAPNGAGDMTAAIFLAKLLETNDPKRSLAHTAAALYAVFRKTHELGRRELAVIQSQDAIIVPPEYFKVDEV